MCLYLVGVERSNAGDLAAPVDTELCEGDDDDDVDEDCDYHVDYTSYEAGMNIDALLKSSNYFLFVKAEKSIGTKKPELPASQERAPRPKQRRLCPDSSPLDRGHLQNGVHETFSHQAQKDPLPLAFHQNDLYT